MKTLTFSFYLDIYFFIDIFSVFYIHVTISKADMKMFCKIVNDEVVDFQVSALLKVKFSIFTLQNVVNCLGTPILRNEFERLFPPFIS